MIAFGLVIGFLCVCVSLAICFKSMLILLTNVLHDKKLLATFSGPLVLAIPGFYPVGVRKYIPRFWFSLLIFIASLGFVWCLGSEYYQTGVSLS